MKRKFFLLAAVLAVAMLVMSACGGISLSIDSTSEKSMTINANKSDPGDYVISGSLEVAEGEQVTLAANLEKGELKVELYGVPEEQSADELPDIEGEEPVTMFNASGTNSMKVEMTEGSYMVKVTTTEKATGTVQIDVTAAK